MICIGGYEIIGIIGKGGVGTVYKARDAAQDRFVALKVLKGSLSRNVSFIERFRREAELARRIVHPNVVQTYEAGKDGARYYICMEYVDGAPLLRLMRMAEPQSAFTEARAIEIVMQIASGLRAAHQAGIIHGDVKPGNILIESSGVAKLSDLGMAAELLADGDARTRGATAKYAAPEQLLRGGRADARSDIFSLGATFFEMLAGVPLRRPHESLDEAARVHNVEGILLTFNPRVSPAVAQIVDSMTAPSPASRFQNCDELLAALSASLCGTPESVYHQS